MSENSAGKEIAAKKIDDYPGRPYVVFLHDSLGCIELWRDFPQKLGEYTRCNVLFYDRIGYGKSSAFSNSRRENDYMEKEADLLIDLLQEWKIEKPFLFGHSDGGTIALIAAAKYPDKFRGIITEGAHIYVEDITLKGIRAAQQSYETTQLKSRLQKYHGDKTDALFHAWTGKWTSAAFRNWSIEHCLPKIKCPLLVIQGEKDEFATLEQANRIVELSGGSSRKLIVSAAGHSPHKEQPHIVLKETAVFIEV